MGTRGSTWQADVLDILVRRNTPLSAYDVLDELRAAHPKIAPPTVYRALAALKDQGRVHRLESLNAYIPCHCSEKGQAAILSICDDCGTVEERTEPDLVSQLTSFVETTGFEAQRHVIEVHGVCGACGPDEAQS